LESFPSLHNYFSNIDFPKFFTCDDFKTYSESKKWIRPGLNNPFITNEENFNDIYTNVLHDDIFALFGNQGVGKTRTAIEIANKLSIEKKYKSIVVENCKDLDKISRLISPKNKYLIIFDNFSPAVKDLESTINDLQTKCKDIKIIITLKKQFSMDLSRELSNFSFNSKELIKMDRNDIREMIKELLIKNKIRFQKFNQLMNKILSLSKGNPTIALMAILPIIDNDNVSYLASPFKIYENYFNNYRDISDFFKNEDVLKSLGVLSFFGYIDKKDSKMTNILNEQPFNFDIKENWNVYKRLNDLEFVDIYEDKIVKISDTILSTYIFYRTFIDENCIFKYTDWIDIFLEDYHGKIFDNIKDIYEVEYNDGVIKKVRDLTYPVYDKFKNNPFFYKIFWNIYGLDTLSFIDNWISNLEPEKIDLINLKIPKINNFGFVPMIRLLSNFYRYDDLKFFKESIKLSLKLILRSPSLISEVIGHLSDEISFKCHDFENDFIVQHNFLDFLNSTEISEDEKLLYEKLLLSESLNLLNLRCHDSKMISKKGWETINGNLPMTSSLLNLRKKVLKNSFFLYNDFPEEVFDIFERYVNSMIVFKDISKYNKYLNTSDELKLCVDFILENLDKNNYNHCKIVYEYNEIFNHNKATLIYLDSFLNSEIINLIKIYDLYFDYPFKESEYKQEIINELEGKNEDYIYNLLKIMNNIVNSLDHTFINILFNVLIEKDINLFKSVFRFYQSKNFQFAPTSDFIDLILKKKLLSDEEVFDLINEQDYDRKLFLNKSFFESEYINIKNDKIFYSFINFISSLTKPVTFMDRNFNNYFRFNDKFTELKDKLPIKPDKIDNINTYLIKILSKNPKVHFFGDFCYGCQEYFNPENIQILKDVFYKNENDSTIHRFGNGKDLEAICNKDENFLFEYLDKNLGSIVANPRYDLSFIWNDNFSDDFINNIVMFLIKEKKRKYSLNLLFDGHNDTIEHNNYIEFKYIPKPNRINNYIEQFIKVNHDSNELMGAIFNVLINSFNKEDYLKFFKKFLELNNDFNSFKNIPLEKSHIIQGSFTSHNELIIKGYNEMINVIKSLPNNLEFHDHIVHLEKLMYYENLGKSEEAEKDFKYEE
jgi:hypothetical protein